MSRPLKKIQKAKVDTICMIPVESKTDRQKEIQNILIQMHLQTKQRGRPKGEG